MSQSKEDPWGRAAEDAVDENLDDIYGDGKRPHSSQSADKWGQNEDEDEIVIDKPANHKTNDTPQQKSTSNSKSNTPKNSQPNSPVPEEESVNNNPKPSTRPSTGSKPGTPVVTRQSPLPNSAEDTESRKSSSKPGTPNRDSPVNPPTSKPGSAKSVTSGSKPGTPSRDNSGSKPGSARSSPQPNPERSSPQPNPERSSPQHNPDRSSPQPNSERSTPQPNPERSSPQPNPERSSPQPNPERSSPQPNAERSSPQPNPERSSPQPNPERSSPQPNPERSSPQPNPERSSSQGTPESPKSRSKPGSANSFTSKPGTPLPTVMNNSRPGSRIGAPPVVIPPIRSSNPDKPLRSDSQTIRDDKVVLPKPSHHKDDIRRKAFENMKNEKARPNYLFTKFSRVVEAVMRYLPYKTLCKSQLVCRVWYRAGKEEKLRRNFVDSDCYKLELSSEDIAKDEDDDVQIDLYRILDEMYVHPAYIIAFMTWRTVTTLPEMLFRILPHNCATTCVSCESGIFGTRKNGKIRIYADKTHECCTLLLIPKMLGFQIFQISAFRPDQLKLDDRYFDSLGMKKYEDKKAIKCLVIFCSGGKSKNANELTPTQLDKWEKEFQNAFQTRCLIVGASVNFCQHGVKKIFGGPSPKLYSTQNDVNGIVFQGENLDVQSFIFDKIDEQSLSGQLDKIGVFVGNSPANSFAIIMNNLSEKDEKSAIRQFKDVLPNTRIAGVKTTGVIFGQNFNSFNDRTSKIQQKIFVGQQYLVLILFRINRPTTRAPSKNRNSNDKNADSEKGKKILKAAKVK